jgi:hypothetical protein
MVIPCERDDAELTMKTNFGRAKGSGTNLQVPSAATSMALSTHIIILRSVFMALTLPEHAECDMCRKSHAARIIHETITHGPG